MSNPIDPRGWTKNFGIAASITQNGNKLPPQPNVDFQGDGVAVSTDTSDPKNPKTIVAVAGGTTVSKQVDSGSLGITKGYGLMQKNGKVTLASAAALGTSLYIAGLALAPATPGATVSLITHGPVDPAVFNVGDGVACAVGLDANGKPVRVVDATCASGLKYLGSCDVHGAIYVNPFNDHHYTVTNYGAVADADGIGGGTDLAAVINTIIGLFGTGADIYIPPGSYRIATTINVRDTAKISGAGRGIFQAPTSLFVDQGVTAFFIPYPTSGHDAQGSQFSDFWIGAVSNNTATLTGASWDATTRQLTVSSSAGFSVGQVICLRGIGGLTRMPYVFGTVTSGSNQVTVSQTYGGGLKVGMCISLPNAYPTGAQITAIDDSNPSAWVLTMSQNAAANDTNSQVSFCFDHIARITAIAGNVITLDCNGQHAGSWPGSIPNTAMNVIVEHADTAFYVNTSISIRGVDIGGGPTGNYGFRGPGYTMVGYTNGVPVSNTDMVTIADSYVLKCKNAVYVQGDAANVNRFIGITSVQPRDWAFQDGCFLGNTFIACHADGGAGFVTTQSAACAGVFSGCYCEGGTASALGDGCLVSGGTMSLDQGGTSVVAGITNQTTHRSLDQSAQIVTQIANFGNGGDSSHAFTRVRTPGHATREWSFRRTDATIDGFDHWIGFRYDEGTRSYAFLIADGDDSEYVSGAPPVWFPGRVHLGGPSATKAERVQLLTGSGSPEGAVTANQGSVYLRNDGGAGTTLYVKESGSGNTGWVAFSSGGGGGWSPASATGLFLWLRADLGVTQVSGNVSHWTDQSSTASDFTPPGTPPTLVSSSINGKPAVRFAAASSEKLNTAHVAAHNAAAYTIVIVFKAASSLAAYAGLLGNPSSGAWSDGFGAANTDGAGGTVGGFVGNVSNEATAGAAGTTAHVLRIEFDGSTISTWLDGAAGATHAATRNDSSGALYIAQLPSGGYFDGDIAEIIALNQVISAPDKTSLDAYLLARYGLSD